jgi:hypothetical protein
VQADVVVVGASRAGARWWGHTVIRDVLRGPVPHRGRDGAQVSLEAISRHAGVGWATLHRRFAGRRALLKAVFDDGVARLWRRGDESADLRARLEDVIEYTRPSFTGLEP